MTKIWFNHWFSTAYHLINLIKAENPGEFIFVGSNKNNYAIYKQICDEWYIEPVDISEENYVEYCLNFCKQHAINIFVPRRNLTAIANCISQFENIGVKVLTGKNPDLMKILDDKVKTYEYISEIGLGEIVPRFEIVNTLADFERAYNSLKTADNRICYKLVKDEGAVTFRVIDESLENAGGLYNTPNAKVTYAAAVKILSQYNFKIPLLEMIYLNGQEISVDCLTTPQGNIIIPRYKNNARYSEIKFDAEIMALAEKILQNLKMPVPVNIQFKMPDGKPYLLEINPRMSGGLQLSCLGAKINIPDLAINQLQGINKSWNYPPFNSCKVANIETPICLEVK